MQEWTSRPPQLQECYVVAAQAKAYVLTKTPEDESPTVDEQDRAAELAELSARSAAGDQAAFRQWVERTTPLVYRLLLRIIGSEQEARDAVQETYVRAWQGLPLVRDYQAGGQTRARRPRSSLCCAVRRL